jgi:hypothetical protein
MTDTYQEAKPRNKPQVQGTTIIPSGYETDMARWPKPYALQRDDLGRSGTPGAYGGVRVTIGQSREEPAPTSEDAIRSPVPTKNAQDSQAMNPDAPLPPEKFRVPMKQQRTE